MTDRAVELATAIMLGGTNASRVIGECERLLSKWEGEDMERAEAMDRPVEQPDLIARLRNPSVQSYSAQKDDQRAAAEEIMALRQTRDDLNRRLSTAIEQLGTVRVRLIAAKQAVRGCLAQMGYANLTDEELVYELKQGNQHIPAIRRARAVLANLDIKPAETPKPAGPDRPRCETCQHWDNSATLDHKENTGMCRGALPERDKRTGEAVWPFSEDTDSCPSHKPPDSGLPY